jgi:hypothetical protein
MVPDVPDYGGRDNRCLVGHRRLVLSPDVDGDGVVLNQRYVVAR